MAFGILQQVGHDAVQTAPIGQDQGGGCSTCTVLKLDAGRRHRSPNVAVEGSEGREGQVPGAELLQGPDYA